MKMFEKALIFRNEKKPETSKAFDVLKRKLVAAGMKLVEAKDADEETIAFILGGDGTVLKASKLLMKSKASVVGINFGHLGFLSPYDFNEINDVLNAIFTGNYRRVKRYFLSVRWNEKVFYCLNDFVIQRAVPSHMLKISVEISKAKMGEMLCDGMIFSTSTGSTAYNLAAGGSVMDPSLKLISIVPMMAHAFAAWPVVVSFEKKVKVEVLPRDHERFFSVSDGENYLEMTEKALFEVSGSDEYLNFICIHNLNFFDLVHTKLGWGFYNGFGGRNEIKV